MSTMVVCSSILFEKFVYVFSKTLNGHNLCFGYSNRANFISIWYRIGFFFCNAVFVVKKLCILLVKLQTAITLALLIETEQILYRFEI